jgi:peroxiredoxin
MKKLQLAVLLMIPSLSYSQINIGTKAPEIDLEGIYNKEDGNAPNLKNLEGQIVVLDFWAIWCSPCIAAIPENNRLYKKYKDKGMQFIAITDDPQEKLENFLQKVKIDFWIGRDDNKQEFKNYNVQGRPQMYILNREGFIVYQGTNITEEMIVEVLATNSLTIPEKNTQSNVVLNGGFVGGEDPLYNGVLAMLGNKTTNRPRLIEQFIIRPSLDSVFGGSGYKIADGHVGITYSAGRLENIFQFLKDLSSPIWITNNTRDSANYDIIYWKKIESLEKAKLEVLGALENGLSIRYDSLQVEKKVNVLFLNNSNEAVRKLEQIEDGSYMAYIPMEVFVSQLEEKSRQYFRIDKSLQNMLVNNQGMDWMKLFHASASEIIEFLKTRGIAIKQEKQIITVFSINKL